MLPSLGHMAESSSGAAESMAPPRPEETSAAFPVRVFTLQEEEQREEEKEQQEQRMDEAPAGGPQVKVHRHRAERDLTLLLLTAAGSQEAPHLRVQDGDGASVFDIRFSGETDCCRVGSQSLLVTHGNLSVLLLCKTPADLQHLCQLLGRADDATDGKQVGHMDRKRGEKRHQDGRRSASQRPSGACGVRTEESAAAGGRYLEFHGCLSQQQNLLQDYQRTATYQRAMLANEADFRDKVVLSVGGGSGILSFFAVQAGAKRVYAVETSPMAEYVKVLVQGNSLSDRITVLEGTVEEVDVPDAVDVIVSEPIGYMLLHERKLDSFLYARKWLKPNGLMFPSSGDIHLAPFTDEQLYVEHHSRTSFWQQRCFYGINLSGLHTAALNEVLRQPIVDTFDMQVLMASSAKHRIHFLQDDEEVLHRIEIPFVFKLLQSGLVHGLAFWFDVAFSGSTTTVWFSTAPTEPLTHWYQVRCLLQTPLFAKLGQTLSGTVLLTTNKRHSYDIHITATTEASRPPPVQESLDRDWIPSAPRLGMVIPNRLFVGQIDLRTTESDIWLFFSQHGVVKEVNIVLNHLGISKGYGFVTFETQEEVQTILRNAAGLVFQSRMLTVGLAVRRQHRGKRSSWPGRCCRPVVTPPCSTWHLTTANGFPYTYHNGMAYFPSRDAASQASHTSHASHHSHHCPQQLVEHMVHTAYYPMYAQGPAPVWPR
ncbi:unnamed protein product [Merluccius merluccius]